MKRYCHVCSREIPKERRKRTCSDECARKAVSDAIMQLHEHAGPVYEKWKLGMKRAVGKL